MQRTVIFYWTSSSSTFASCNNTSSLLQLQIQSCEPPLAGVADHLPPFTPTLPSLANYPEQPNLFFNHCCHCPLKFIFNMSTLPMPVSLFAFLCNRRGEGKHLPAIKSSSLSATYLILDFFIYCNIFINRTNSTSAILLRLDARLSIWPLVATKLRCSIWEGWSVRPEDV